METEESDKFEKNVEEEIEEDENEENEMEAESPTLVDSPSLVERKNSADSPDSRAEPVDSEEEEEELSEAENKEEVKAESPGTSTQKKSPDLADIGEEADSESGEPKELKKPKNNGKKKSKKAKKKRKKKKDMNKGDVLIGAAPKKRARAQPNKRKKIRKLLMENQLQEETLQALKDEEERRKRLGHFTKEDNTPTTNGNGVSFEPLDEDQFPDLSCNLDFMDNLDMDITPMSGTALNMLPVTCAGGAESNGNGELAELKSADIKAAFETNTVAMETPALHPTESSGSLSNEVTRLEQLLRTENESKKETPNGQTIVAMPTGPITNGTAVAMENQNGTHTETLYQLPPVSDTPKFIALPSSGDISTIVSSTPTNTPTEIALPTSLAQMTFPSYLGHVSNHLTTVMPLMGYPPIPTLPRSTPPYTGFETPVSTNAKPASSEVICISSGSSDDEKGKKPQQQSPSLTVQKSKPIDTISISSGSESSSDDVIFAGTDDNEFADEEVDVNNSGMHVDDSMNQPDEEGRVLVNKNRPSDEQEIYLAPQLARAVKPHQIGGIRFMFDNIVESLEHYKKSNGFGCILAHSMGLGKTLQVISFIDVFLRYTEAKTALCVVPVNTLLNWIGEFEMWLPMTKNNYKDSEDGRTKPRAFKVRLLSESHKTTEARAQVISSWKTEGGVLLMGYEMFRLLTNQKSRQRKKKKQKNGALGGIIDTIDLNEDDKMTEVTAEIYENLVKPGPDLIVCDEGHRIKNSHASISQALKQIATRRRIVLTGYPLQNNLMEYWCMVDFVRPNFLGAKQEFSNMFERPICNGQCADSNESDIRLMRFRSHVLHSLLKGFVQRRSHLVLRNSLPPKEEYVLLVRLSRWQKKLYNSFIKQQKEQGSGSWCSSLNPIKAFSICCKIWNHPDVLYRAVVRKTLEEQQSSEPNGILDMDLDLPEPVMESILKKARRKREARAEKAADAIPGSGGKLVQSVGLSPFGEEKDRGMNYDWAIDLLEDYAANKLEFSGKMLILMEIIRHSITSGDKILVFSQSLTTLTLIEEFLSEMDVPNPPNGPQVQRKWRRNDSYFRLDGNTNTSEREKMIQLFNDKNNSSVHLFLLSTRAGCLGINLVGANRVVVFDISWNPCHDAQAVCRVYRYGQTKKCVIYRLICDQSMEKKIYDRQISKQGMSDRVVDELNPVQSMERQDVTKLLVYDDEDLPPPDVDECIQAVNDETLKHTCKIYGTWLTKKPFHHESLLMDCKGSRLTKAEKRAAQKAYELEKRASNSCNYSRPSYANFYAAAGYPAKTTAGSKSGPNSKISSIAPTTQPLANERPSQSTPYPMQMSPNLGLGTESGDSRVISVLQRSGINVKRTVATHDIPLPQSSVGPHSKPLVAAGEPFYMIHGAKGIYIGTTTGRIFALRSQKAEENKAPSPLVQGPGGQMVTSRERESQVIKTAFNAAIRRSTSGRHGMRNPYGLLPPPSNAGFPTNFGHPRNESSLVNLMTGQNLSVNQQNPLLTQQRPVMSHQINLMNQQNNATNHHSFQSRHNQMQNGNATLQNGESTDPISQQDGPLKNGTGGPSALQSQLGLTQSNFPSLNYPMAASQNFQGDPYRVPGYFTPSWMNPHQNGSAMYQGNGVMHQMGNMTQQNGSMNQQLLPTNGEVQPTLAAVNMSANGDESASNDMLTQQNGFLSQQYLPSPSEGNSKDAEITQLDSLLTQQPGVAMVTGTTVDSLANVSHHSWMLNQQSANDMILHNMALSPTPPIIAVQQID